MDEEKYRVQERAEAGIIDLHKRMDRLIDMHSLLAKRPTQKDWQKVMDDAQDILRDISAYKRGYGRYSTDADVVFYLKQAYGTIEPMVSKIVSELNKRQTI